MRVIAGGHRVGRKDAFHRGAHLGGRGKGGNDRQQERAAKVGGVDRIQRPKSAVPALRRGRDEDQPGDMVGMVKRPGQSFRPAVGLAEHEGFVGPELGGGGLQQRGLFGQRFRMGGKGAGIGRIGPARIAQSGPVKGDDPVAVGQTVDEVKIEIAQIAAGPMDQHQIGAGAAHQHMHRHPAHVDDLADGRKVSLGLRLAGGGTTLYQRGATGQNGHPKGCEFKRQSHSGHTGLIGISR